MVDFETYSNNSAMVSLHVRDDGPARRWRSWEIAGRGNERGAHGHEGAGCADDAERRGQPRRIGGKPDERRPGEIAEVAGGGHSGDGGAGVGASASGRAEEYRDEIRHAEANQTEAEHSDAGLSHDEADRSEASRDAEQARAAQPTREGIARESSEGHGERESREPHGRNSRRGAERVAKIHGTPVAYRALDEQSAESEETETEEGRGRHHEPGLRQAG